MKKHIELLGILNIIYHFIEFLVGVGFFLFFPSIGLITGEPIAMGILTIIGTLLGGFLLVLSIPGIIAGFGLLKLRPWARILALIMACVNMLSIPVGTALGVYSFWVLMKDEVIQEFSKV
jgi:hypothetical protein